MPEEKLRHRIADDVKEYVGMRIDAVKLSLVEELSSIAGRGIALVICLFLVALALMLFTGVAVYGISLLTGSVLWAAVIMGFLYLLIGLWVLLRPGIFVNMMVGIFSKSFFKTQKEEDDDDDD